MMKKFLFISIFIFLQASLTNAEVVNKIEISGNKRVSDETIKIYGGIKINKDYSENDTNKILTDLYSTNFFEDVSLEILNGVLKVRLKEYPVINELLIIGEPSKKYKTRVKKLLKLKEKNSFIKSNLSSDIETIKQVYSSIGYNFVEVNSKIRKIDESNLDLIFDIKRGNISKISKISFTGDKKIREKRLRDVIASEEDRFYKIISRNTKFSQNLINLDKRLLTNYYKSIGYYDVNVVSNSAQIGESGNIELTYSIDAGNRYVINKISTNVDPVFDKNLFYPLNEYYSKITGDYYSPFKVKKILQEIDNLIDRNNLQFVEHNVEENIEGDTISLKFNIYEGEKILVERINVLGNNVTNENVIRSELLLDEGDPFTNLGLEKSEAKLRSRNIFGIVKTTVKEGSAPNLKIIDVEVEERPTGEISAGAGVGTNGGSFGINIQENNWLGEGKQVGFDMELTEESLRGTIDYTNPNYDLLGNSLNYIVSSIRNDKPDQGYENTLITAGASTSFEQYKDIFANIGLFYSYDDLRTQDNASASLKKQSGEFSDLAAEYGFKYDLRDRAFMPTDGSVTSFNQTIPVYADKSFISNTFSNSIYHSFNENVVGAGKLFLTSVNGLGGDDVRLSKRKVLKSSRLRGFQKGKVGPVDGKDHVGGNYAAALNFEATLPKLLPESTKTDIGLFLDFANVWGVDYDSTIDESSTIRSSTGVAASWLSPLGPMTFIFSTNLSKASTDKTESFNFNLGTTF